MAKRLLAWCFRWPTREGTGCDASGTMDCLVACVTTAQTNPPPSFFTNLKEQVSPAKIKRGLKQSRDRVRSGAAGQTSPSFGEFSADHNKASPTGGTG